MSLKRNIETYIRAKDGNRPHRMVEAFAQNARLSMLVKTSDIAFPSSVEGRDAIESVLVREFAAQYENVYTFCLSDPPSDTNVFVCDWLVCMTEKATGAARLGFGQYEWHGDFGLVGSLRITIEEMRVLEEHTFTALADINRIIADKGWIGALEAFETHRARLDSDAASTLDPRVRVRLELGRPVPSSRRSELLALRAQLQAVFVRELQEATLIMPTVGHTPPLLAPLEADQDLFAAVNMKTLAMTMPASFLDAPVVAMPSGWDSNSLPTGVQLIRSSNDDHVLLSVAQRVERYMQTSRIEERNDA